MAGLEEKWSEVMGYDGKYLISNNGLLKSFKYTEKGRLLAKNINRLGYSVYTLSNNSKTKTHTIHRLVAIAFIPNPDNKDFVNHKDGNKLNNNVDNLEWCTHSENMIHAITTGLKTPISGICHYNSRFNKSEILDIRNSQLSESKLATRYGVNRATIGKIKRLERYKNI